MIAENLEIIEEITANSDNIAEGELVYVVTVRLLPPAETRPRGVRHVFSDVVNDLT